ncbi:MAG: signal recognition particle-docking protein FtsY [Candidatus Aminicenantes bacterium]|nr:signal recognition particle-docking protein FtsY [Candidatus Aminicenantes bacterium]
MLRRSTTSGWRMTPLSRARSSERNWFHSVRITRQSAPVAASYASSQYAIPAGRYSRAFAPAAGSAPTVILMVGANGGGKTTSAAKLAARFKSEGRKVVLAAADTFRAAAQEQLALWGKRLGVPVFKGSYGADPAAVVFDAAQSFKAQCGDVLLIDTAGRVHTNANLMNELEKVRRVVTRELPDARVESLLVLDATVGQNAVLQAREFLKFSGLTGIVLTKIDGTAKGGAAVAIAAELGLPIKFIGVGESEEDLVEFSPREFVEALLS